jgi:hypothetical protein
MTISLVHFICTDLFSVTESYFLSGINLDFTVVDAYNKVVTKLLRGEGTGEELALKIKGTEQLNLLMKKNKIFFRDA